MVVRRAQRGAHAGSEFWGCSNVPEKQRHTELRLVLGLTLTLFLRGCGKGA
jgi:hypothetical protein